MIYQPTLKKLDVTSSEFEYKFRFYSLFVNPEDDRLDGSHIHSCYEIYINISGDVDFLVNNRIYPIKSGDMVLTRPNDMHVCIINTPCLHEHFCLYFNCAPDNPALNFFNGERYTPVMSLEDGERKKLIDTLYALRDADEQNRPLARASYLFSLFSRLNEDDTADSAKHGSAMSLPDELQKILDYINVNFTEIKYIEDIINETYVSATTLNRWFKRYIHLTPREYLEMKKLAYAKILLDEDKSVTDACMESGFSDCSHFISVFKKKFGITPNKYKK